MTTTRREATLAAPRGCRSRLEQNLSKCLLHSHDTESCEQGRTNGKLCNALAPEKSQEGGKGVKDRERGGGRVGEEKKGA